MKVWIVKGFNLHSDVDWIEGVYSSQKSAQEEVNSLQDREEQECDGDCWVVKSYEVLD